MKFSTQLITQGKLHVENTSNQPQIVLIFPITRVSPENTSRWVQLLSIANDSLLSSLVIIDKTKLGEATQFFSTPNLLKNTNIFILRRPPTEPIYNSQAFITIDKGMWIIQLHDDDQWNGVLKLPKDALGLELFSTNFMLMNSKEQGHASWLNSPPSRINFTVLPSEVWNRFTKFIDSQDGHVAGSMDSTLNLVSRIFCTQRHLPDFEYTYDDRHWASRRHATKNLKALARQDGWGNFSGVDIALLNRTLDGISAINFFAPLSLRVNLEAELCNYKESMTISLKRYLLIKAKFMFYDNLFRLLRLFSIFFGSKRLKVYLDFIDAQRVINRVLIGVGTDLKASNLNENLKILRKHVESPFLKKRIDFWIENLR